MPMLSVKYLYTKEKEAGVTEFSHDAKHLEGQFEYESAPLLVPLTLIMAYYNLLSSFQ